MNEDDYKLLVENLKNSLEYERNLNQQMLGRMDTYEYIIKSMLKLLIDAATERSVKWE